MNYYFSEGMLPWEANSEIKPAFNHYKAIVYLCAYLSKSEDESRQTMGQAAQKIRLTKNWIIMTRWNQLYMHILTKENVVYKNVFIIF